MEITIEAIEALTSHPDAEIRCASIASVAEALGCHRQILWEWMVRNRQTGLIKPGGIDHGVVRRYISKGATIPSEIARGISSKNHTVLAAEVSGYMQKNGLRFPEQEGSRPTRGSRFKRVDNVELVTKINHAGKEFPRETPEMRRCRLLRENYLDARNAVGECP
jgi:transposase-like protein